MSSMSSSELTFLGSDMDEDPGPRRWTRRISRFRNEPKIDRHVQHTPTRATRETKRVPRVLNSEDEVSDNSTTPTRHVPVSGFSSCR